MKQKCISQQGISPQGISPQGISPQDISQQEIDKTRCMCEDYMNAVERIKESNLRIDNLKKQLESDIPDYSRWLYQQEIEDLKSQSQKDIENTGYLRWALGHLTRKEQSVMEQLYLKKIPWEQVTDENGKAISAGAIDCIRHRCFRKIANLILEMKKSISGKSEGEEESNGTKDSGKMEGDVIPVNCKGGAFPADTGRDPPRDFYCRESWKMK